MKKSTNTLDTPVLNCNSVCLKGKTKSKCCKAYKKKKKKFCKKCPKVISLQKEYPFLDITEMTL
jgi:hypothetical protein